MIDLNNIKVGQLVTLTYKYDDGNVDWDYGVMKNIYDNRIEIIRKNNSDNFLLTLDNDSKEMYEKIEGKSHVVPLYIDGKPAMAKKNIFGDYKFEPTEVK